MIKAVCRPPELRVCPSFGTSRPNKTYGFKVQTAIHRVELHLHITSRPPCAEPDIIAGMYRTQHFRWKLMHIWGILVHLFLVVAVAIGFLYDLGRPYQLEQWEYPGHPTAIALHPCRYHAAIEGHRYDFAFDRASRTSLLKISLGLVCLFRLFLFLPRCGGLLVSGRDADPRA